MPRQQSYLPHLAAGQPASEGDFLLSRRYRLVSPYLAGRRGSLLDFGCGNGAQTFLFAGDFERVIGLDIDRVFLKECRQGAAGSRLGAAVQPVAFDGQSFPCGDATFEVAISFEVLEHVGNEQLALAELYRVLKPGGLLAISVPNRWWIFETHGANLPLLPWNRVPLFSWLPNCLHDRYARARIYRKRDFEHMLKVAGFTIERSVYVTAPMDVLKWRPLQKLLRTTIFADDSTRVPILATAVLALATR